MNKRFSKFWLRLKNPMGLRKILMPKKAPRNIWKRIGRWSLYTLVLFIFMVAFAFAWYSKDLPTPEKIAKRSATQSTKIYDRSGTILLYETGEQKRTIVASDQFADLLKKATVATEDANFYKHNGFDTKAIAEAVLQKILHRTAKARGASTITQQYVKTALLDSDRTMTRKIKELILSIELEVMYSKDEILTMYLNEIPYGGNIAGAEAAANTYFGKQAKDLDLAQAATLVAIPQSPTYYYPYGTHTKQLIDRRNYVIDRMQKVGYVSKDQAEAAKLEDTTTIGTALRPRKDSILAPHFAMFVIEQAQAEFGEEKIQKEGYKIITTLDFDKQKIAEEALASGSKKLSAYNASNAAIVSVDPNTGEILAMLGSLDYFNTAIDGNVNVTDSARQPGSSFKPFAYATLFKDKAYSPSKIIYDLQTDFGGGYIPRNYNGNFNGPVTIRTALSNSLNIPAVKALSLAGIDNTIRTASEMGITTLTERDRYGLSLVLGAGEVKPVEMAGAFSVFASGGIKHDLKSILKVTDARGKIIYEYNKDSDKGRQVLDPQIAYEISSILSDNNARSAIFGSHSALAFSGKTIAAKTGTTSSFKDAWTVGFSKNIATAVWVGNNDAKAMKNGADGSIVAAPIFHTFMDKIVTKDEPFDRPAEIQSVTVEKYSNKLPSDLSGETTTDIFASWQVPAEKDNVHIKMRICNSSGLPADDSVSADLVSEKVYTNIHSERPDNPSWEGPVRNWASAHNMDNPVPAGKCDPGSSPTVINITSPANNSDVSGTLPIAASVSSSFSISSVIFYIDGISVGSDNSAPYEINYNFDTLTQATHTVMALVEDAKGANAKSTITVNIVKDIKAPVISSIVVTKINSTSYRVAWDTDEASMSQVIYGTISMPLPPYNYANNSVVNPSLVTHHSIDITVLNGTKYYFRVISADALGNVGISNPENSFDS